MICTAVWKFWFSIVIVVVFDGCHWRQVWARDLANGDKAVVLYNDGRVAKSALNITVSWADIG